MENKMFRARCALIVLALVSGGLAKAQTPPAATPGAQTQEQRQRELSEAFNAGVAAGQTGQADIPLLAQATLHLPQGYIFIPQPHAERIMRALGNGSQPRLAGLVLSSESSQNWMIKIDFVAAGYVKDDEAKEWKPDELLQSLKEGTETANADRIARGFEPIEVLAWAEPPAYDDVAHRLVWAATSREKNNPSSALGVNYNTYALGRDGYFTVNLLTAADGLALHKIHSRTLLTSLDYKDGKRYADFNANTDHVASYGITALIGGAVLAKKFGLFALLGLFIAKAGKLAVLAGAGLVYAFRKLFSRQRPPAA